MFCNSFMFFLPLKFCGGRDVILNHAPQITGAQNFDNYLKNLLITLNPAPYLKLMTKLLGYLFVLLGEFLVLFQQRLPQLSRQH